MSRVGNLAATFVLVALGLGAALQSAAQTADIDPGDPVVAAMNRLSIDLPVSSYLSASILNPLGALGREPCDQIAIIELITALKEKGYRRQAANAGVEFSDSCGGHAEPLRKAANIYIDLSDYKSAAATATKIIDLEPYEDNGYFLRGYAYDKMGQSLGAIDDFTTSIELFADKSQVSSYAYMQIAKHQAKLGRFCEASAVIESWVMIDPAKHDNSKSRALISDYSSKGQCKPGTVGKEEEFPLSKGDDVATVTVSVNGEQGVFVIDTGATFVSLKESFAQKAEISIEAGSSVVLHTANGVGEGKRGVARTIKLRSLEATDVAVVVQADEKAAYGEDVVGLLGMSFLSRFDMAFKGGRVRVSRRSLH